MKKLVLVLSIWGILGGTPAWAQNRGVNFLGGRSSGMGGTAIAFGDGPGMVFYNPAGLARVPSHILSLSAAAYSFDAYLYDKFYARDNPPEIAPFDGELRGNELRSSAINTYPSSLSYIAHIGKHNLAFSVLLPRVEKRDLEGTLRFDSLIYSSDNISLISNDETYYIGPSYARQWTSSSGLDLLVGATVFVSYTQWLRNYTFNRLSSRVPATNFNVSSSSVFSDAKSFDLLGIFGLQIGYKNYRLGLVINTPSTHLGGSYDQTTIVNFFGNLTDDSAETTFERQTKGDFEDRQPLRLGIGVAYETSKFTIGSDLNFLIPTGSYVRISGDSDTSNLVENQRPENATEFISIRQDERMLLSASVGVEYRVNKTYALRVGGFSNLSSLDPDELDRFTSEAIDRFGASLGLGIDIGGAETAVTFAYVGGFGKVVGFDSFNSENNPEGTRRVDVLQSSFLLVISGAVDINAILQKSG